MPGNQKMFVDYMNTNGSGNSLCRGQLLVIAAPKIPWNIRTHWDKQHTGEKRPADDAVREVQDGFCTVHIVAEGALRESTTKPAFGDPTIPYSAKQ